jgi:hypothetical protein
MIGDVCISYCTLPHIRSQCRLFGGYIEVGAVLIAKRRTAVAHLLRVSMSPYVRLFDHSLQTPSKVFSRSPQTFFCAKGCSSTQPVLPRRMASKLSTILDGLQQRLSLINELVACIATLPPASDQPWPPLATNCSNCTPTLPSILLSPNCYCLVPLKRTCFGRD